jgi:hypothetical protein
MTDKENIRILLKAAKELGISKESLKMNNLSSGQWLQLVETASKIADKEEKTLKLSKE